MRNNKIRANFNLRYNLLSAFVYLIGAILIMQLFRLQIINGAEYRETSNARLTRESTIEGARGNIEVRNETVLATTKTGYSVELYKTKNTNKELNDVILKIVNLLESNEDKYINNFPIDFNLKFTYTSNEKIKNWKIKNKIDENATVQECINIFKEKYEITNEKIEEVLKIIAVRYEITTNGYSTTKSIKIASEAQGEISPISSYSNHISVAAIGTTLFIIRTMIVAASSRVRLSLGASSVSLFPLIIPRPARTSIFLLDVSE